MSNTTHVKNKVLQVRTVPVIPTTSIVQIWEKLQDKLDVSELYLKVSKASQGQRLEVSPYMTLNRRPSHEELIVNYKKRLHGVESLGNLCYRIEREGFNDAFIARIVFSDHSNEYAFQNVPAPEGLSGYVKAIRSKFLKQHGLQPTPQLLMLRVLRLVDAKPKMWWTAEEKKTLEVLKTSTLFSEDLLTTLKREYGAIFCKLTETEEKGTVIHVEVAAREIENTVWW